jgi:hypothetical protein
MKLSNKVYDVLKWVALIALDALGVFYSTISDIWALPFGDEVLKTCAALSVLIGTLIGVSSIKHKRETEGK